MVLAVVQRSFVASTVWQKLSGAWHELADPWTSLLFLAPPPLHNWAELCFTTVNEHLHEDSRSSTRGRSCSMDDS